MEEGLRIYVDRLRTQGVERIEESLAPDFLEVQEADLSFIEPVQLSGEAYLAQDELVVKVFATVTAQMVCAICNQPVALPLQAEVLHMEPLVELKNGIFNMGPIVREALLLELPLVAECNQGQCPDRAEIEQYLRKKKSRIQTRVRGFGPLRIWIPSKEFSYGSTS